MLHHVPLFALYIYIYIYINYSLYIQLYHEIFTSATPSDPTFGSPAKAGSTAETPGTITVRPAERVRRNAARGTSEGNLRRAAKGAEMLGLLMF